MECGGYAARIYSHQRPFVVGAFVAQYFLIVVVSPVHLQAMVTVVLTSFEAPVLFSAAIYLSLNLIVRAFPGTDRLLLLKPKLVLACSSNPRRSTSD